MNVKVECGMTYALVAANPSEHECVADMALLTAVGAVSERLPTSLLGAPDRKLLLPIFERLASSREVPRKVRLRKFRCITVRESHALARFFAALEIVLGAPSRDGAAVPAIDPGEAAEATVSAVLRAEPDRSDTLPGDARRTSGPAWRNCRPSG